VTLNGRSLNGVSLNGGTLGGSALTGVTLNGSMLQGTKSGGGAISGANMKSSIWNATLSDGTVTQLRIDSAATLASPNGDIWAYGISLKSGTTWVPACGSASVLAIPVYGTFNNGEGVTGGGSFTYDASKITFGCRGYAIAKCVELGYKPWKTAVGVNLRNHHVACTRMLRADYCGNGSSYTADGMQINLYDALAVQRDTSAWRMDAEWTANGARCVKQSSPPRVSVAAPACYTAKISSTCGALTSFALGTLLFNEVP
jgi:hypothetical protein